MTHHSPKSPVVLVVDDDPTSRMVVGEGLALEDFEVLECDGGEKAVHLFETHRPDLVVMDALMPGVDGFGACRAIRQSPGGLDIPILMLTGLEDADAVTRAYEAGATDFAIKPMHWQLLAHRARYMLRARHTLDALRRSEARLQRAQQIARLGHWERELGTGELHWSAGLSRLFGLAPDTPVADFDAVEPRIHADDRDAVRTARARLETDGTYQVDFRIVWTDGTVRFVHEQADTLPDEHGAPARIVGTVQDVTERRAAEERVRFLAHYDDLTGLANRRLLADHLRLALARARRDNRLVAILFLDLDGFKRINDTLGHAVGDHVLQAAAKRIRACVRETDLVGRDGAEPRGSQQSVARFAGDEFVVVLADLQHGSGADVVSHRILRALREPLLVEGHEVVLTACIGISLFPTDGADVETLLRNADAAMYHAKQSGRDGHHFYDESLNAPDGDRLQLEAELHRALDRDEFRLYFQPLVEGVTGRIVGAEALIRWQHPTRGLLAPDAFIPIAEETGLIVPIGEWVLRTACAHARAWSDAGFGPLPVSVNLSGRQFERGDLVQVVEQSLGAAGVAPQRLELEITERLLMRDRGDTVDTLDALRARGIRIAVDDFGTGYSSLEYLKRFSVDRIKIDRSFVRDVATNPCDGALVETIIGMARALRLDTVAEGVETPAQAEFLRARGCQYLQGYLFGRPSPVDQFRRLLEGM